MAEREPGPYWVRDKDGWSIALWNGGYWKLLEAPGAWSEDAFAEIGEHVERRLSAEEIAGPEGISAYDLTKPTAQMPGFRSLSCLDEVRALVCLAQLLRLQMDRLDPPDDAHLAWAELDEGSRQYYLTIAERLQIGWPEPQPITDAQKTGERFLVWYEPDPDAEYGANPGDDPARENGWQTAWWDGVDWTVGGEGYENHLRLIERRVTYYLLPPPDVK